MENSGQVEGLIAENLRFLGQESEAWKHRYRAALLLYNFRSSLRLHNLMWESGKAAVEEDRPAAALFFQDEGIAVARNLGDPRFLAEALLRRSRILIALLKPLGALEDLRTAERSNGIGPDLSNDTTAKRVLIDIAFAKGEALRQLNPSASLPYLSGALKAFKERQLTLDVAEAYLAHARSSVAVGDEVAAGKDLRSAIELFEKRRLRIEDDNFRQSFSETAQQVYDETILFALRQGKERSSLELSERARIVPVVGSLGQTAEGRVSRALADLPKGVVFVEYAVTSQRLLIWMLHRGAFAFEERSIEERELRRLVESFVAEVRDPARTAEHSRLSGRLYDLLLPGALSAVPKGIEICFVPDKELNGIPFAALRNARSGRYLVEDHAISLSPSVVHAVAESKNGGAMRDESSLSALLVGDPALNRQHFPGLPEIRSALVEVNRLRSLYSEAQVIVGKNATRENILPLLDRYEIFHYAGHAVPNPRHPAYSFLALAPSVVDAGSDALFAHEIAERHFTRLRLVVLSACNTIESADSRTAGLTGLARPFLDAGAAAVLGTLWTVSDRVAREALPEFHRQLLRSRDAAFALRETQLRLLRNPDTRLRSSTAWAVFEVVGSNNHHK
jgi:CHAT domain-containing protein